MSTSGSVEARGGGRGVLTLIDSRYRVCVVYCRDTQPDTQEGQSSKSVVNYRAIDRNLGGFRGRGSDTVCQLSGFFFFFNFIYPRYRQILLCSSAPRGHKFVHKSVPDKSRKVVFILLLCRHLLVYMKTNYRFGIPTRWRF